MDMTMSTHEGRMVMTALYISLFSIVLCIVVAFRYKINIGIMATCMALLIGTIFLEVNPPRFFSLIPTNILFAIISITFFYGVFLENGTLLQVVNFLLQTLHRKSMIPWFIFSLCIFIAGIGVGAPSTSAIIAPIAMSLAVYLKQPSLLYAAAISYGACIGGNFILGQGGLIAITLIGEEVVFGLSGQKIIFYAFIHSLIIYTAIFAVVFVKNRPENILDLEEKADRIVFTDIQKKSICLIGGVVAFIIIHSVINNYYSDTLIGGILINFDISYIMVLGIMIAMILNLADMEKVIKRFIPWQTLIAFAGMSLLLGISKEAGLIEWLTYFMTRHIPVILLLPALAVVAGFMSCFSSTTAVVLPTLFPLVPELCAAFQTLPPTLFYSAIFIGSTGAGISPFSTGGALLLSNCQAREEQEGLLNGLLKLCIINILFTACYFGIIAIL